MKCLKKSLLESNKERSLSPKLVRPSVSVPLRRFTLHHKDKNVLSLCRYLWPRKWWWLLFFYTHPLLSKLTPIKIEQPTTLFPHRIFCGLEFHLVFSASIHRGVPRAISHTGIVRFDSSSYNFLLFLLLQLNVDLIEMMKVNDAQLIFDDGPDSRRIDV